MWVTLIFGSSLCLFFLLRSMAPHRPLAWTILAASAVLGVFIVGVTEVLSVMGRLEMRSLAAAWGGLCALTAMGLWMRRRKRLNLRPAGVSWAELLMWTGVGVIWALTLTVAVLAPPNAGDALGYHMPRVVHRAQNQTVLPFPTDNLRELYGGPFAEYTILHLQLLSGTDRFANLVQWWAMCASVLAVALFTRLLGFDSRAATMAAVVAATIPMMILQSSSANNDCVVALWIIGFAFFGLEATKRLSPGTVLLASSSLGLAWLTKATAYLFTLPWLIWIAWRVVRGARWRGAAVAGGILAGALLTNAPFSIRTAGIFWDRLRAADVVLDHNSYLNSAAEWRLVAANVIREAALHISTPSGSLNAGANRVCHRVLAILGVDPNDPRITLPGRRFEVNSRMWRYESGAGNPAHALLVALAIAYLLLPKRDRRLANVRVSALVAATGFLTFCVALKWSTIHSRLHMPLFVMCAPAIGIVLRRIPLPVAGSAVTITLLLLSSPYVLLNARRPLIGSDSVVVVDRATQYLAFRPAVLAQYREAAELLQRRRCGQVGLMLRPRNQPEYALWRLAREAGASRLEHVGVANETARITRGGAGAFVPCAVIQTGESFDAGKPLRLADYSFRLAWQGQNVRVLLRENFTSTESAFTGAFGSP